MLRNNSCNLFDPKIANYNNETCSLRIAKGDIKLRIINRSIDIRITDLRIRKTFKLQSPAIPKKFALGLFFLLKFNPISFRTPVARTRCEEKPNWLLKAIENPLLLPYPFGWLTFLKLLSHIRSTGLRACYVIARNDGWGSTAVAGMHRRTVRVAVAVKQSRAKWRLLPTLRDILQTHVCSNDQRAITTSDIHCSSKVSSTRTSLK